MKAAELWYNNVEDYKSEFSFRTRSIATNLLTS